MSRAMGCSRRCFGYEMPCNIRLVVRRIHLLVRFVWVAAWLKPWHESDMLTPQKSGLNFRLLPSQAQIKASYSCTWPLGVPGGCDPSAWLTGFFVCDNLMPKARDGHAVIQALHIKQKATGTEPGGLNSVNSGQCEKWNWWDRVCNTTHMDGEDSVHDPHGCRVLTFPTGYQFKAFLLRWGKAEYVRSPLGLRNNAG